MNSTRPIDSPTFMWGDPVHHSNAPEGIRLVEVLPLPERERNKRRAAVEHVEATYRKRLLFHLNSSPGWKGNLNIGLSPFGL
ncbi:hypothetical protein JOD24_001342 [Kroppenstedtia sanguinis]